MNIETVMDEGRLEVKASGELDLHSQRRLRDLLQATMREESPCGLCLDLRGIDFIDSAGARLLSDLSYSLKQKRTDFVLKLSPRVQKTLGVLISAGLLVV